MKFKIQNSKFKIRFAWRIVLFLSAGWLMLAWLAAQWLVVEKPLLAADAIFVFSGSAAVGERTQKAAALFRENLAPKIVLTNDGLKAGWSRDERRNLFYWELAQRELIAQGVPAQAIEVLPARVAGTHDEAVLLAKSAKNQGWRSVVLVTSAYHTRRALWETERVAADNDLQIRVGIGSPPPGEQAPTAFFWWSSPKGWRAVAGEYLKFVYYWLFY